MQQHDGHDPKNNQSKDNDPPKLRGIPANSPAQALALAEYQDGQARALRAARIADCERALSSAPSASNDSHEVIDRLDRLRHEIEKRKGLGGGEITVYRDPIEDLSGRHIEGSSVALRFFANSNTGALLRKALSIANDSLDAIEVSNKTSDIDHRFNEVFSSISPTRIQTLGDLKVIADSNSLYGVASDEEWLSAVVSFLSHLPEQATLPSSQRDAISRVCEELLQDPASQRQEIAQLASYHLSQTSVYNPSWRTVMDERERQHMALAQEMFFELAGIDWSGVKSAEQLLFLARKNGNILQVLVCFCTAVPPESGILAHRSVLKPLFSSPIPELNQEDLLSVALAFKKTQRMLANFDSLESQLANSPDCDPDNF
jgi:hypothetical protein